jgi:hypothetical protein
MDAGLLSNEHMLAKDAGPTRKLKAHDEQERRKKLRFPVQRDLRYKLLKDGATLESGVGQTLDMGSGGIGFSTERDLPHRACIELSISWPVLLDETCAMRLVVFGRVVRNEAGKCACTVDKWEFRTQARVIPTSVRIDSKLQRWADAVRKDAVTPINRAC